MNINDYISSGILEQYVLGDISPQEKKEVECMSHIYPEIKEELVKVQLAIEGLAMENAVTVPSHLKKNIFDQIEKETTIEVKQTSKLVNLNTSTAVNETNVVSIKKYLVAASISLAVGATSVYVILQNSFNQKELALNKKVDEIAKDNEDVKNKLAILSVENNKTFVLQGNAKAPGKTMVVLWNNKTGNVYVNNVQLPQAPIDKQYQLWALKDGKPIDLGVFNADGSIQNMKSVAGAQAFAVTLEVKGGSPTPHLEELYAITNI
ncbi:MAG: anti-sigma factor [Chitinophagaceae bacterium]